MLGVIFDLDQTLLDSSLAAANRKARAWPAVYAAIPHFAVFDGIIDLMALLQKSKVPMCIVTKSPSPYCSKVIAHWKLPINLSVCYHDVKNRKPHPESMNKAAELLKMDKAHIVAVGDHADDITAAKAADIHSIAAVWGAEDVDALLAAEPDSIVNTVAELHELLRVRLN